MAEIDKNKQINKKGTAIKRRVQWPEEAEKLVEVWSEKLSELRGNRKNSHVYAEMAELVNTLGFDYEGADIRIKLHNMTNRYRLEKKKTGPSGGSPSDWRYFESVHEILGSSKVFNLQKIMEQSSDFSEFYEFEALDETSPENSNSEPSCSSSVVEPAKKKNKKNVQEEVLIKLLDIAENELKETKAARQALAESEERAGYYQTKIIDIEEKRNKLLKKLNKQNRVFQSQLLEVLRNKK